MAEETWTPAAEPVRFIADELAVLNTRLTENLQVVAQAVNALADRVAALDDRLRTNTDLHAEILGKALRHMARG